MVKLSFAIVFHCDPDTRDLILNDLKKYPDVDLVFIKQSWGKLWIQEGEEP